MIRKKRLWMTIAFLSKLIEFIDSDLPYFYYCDDEMKDQIIKNIDLTVSAFGFYKYYDSIFSNVSYKGSSNPDSQVSLPQMRRRKKNRFIPHDFKEAMNQLKGYTLNKFGILIHFK